MRSLTEGKSWRQMISLVGEGRIGKTTLARTVFNHQEVEKLFDCQAWITISQAYNMKDVLKNMIRKISSTLAFSLGDQDRTVEELVYSLRQPQLFHFSYSGFNFKPTPASPCVVGFIGMSSGGQGRHPRRYSSSL